MERDIDEEILLKRKLLELSKRKQTKEKTPRQVLIEHLYDRGDEVLTAAETQYPEQTKLLIDKLAQLIKQGNIKEMIGGRDLLALFKYIGLNVTVETSIKFAKGGKVFTIADKLKEN